MNVSNKNQLLFAAAVLFADSAFANGSSNETANLTISSSVLGTCAIAAGRLSIAPTSTTGNTDSKVDISITCSSGMTATLFANRGIHATNATRRIKHSLLENYLSYDLFTSNARILVLNDTNSGITYNGNGSAKTLEIFVRTPNAQYSTATPGEYSDTVQMRISYTP